MPRTLTWARHDERRYSLAVDAAAQLVNQNHLDLPKHEQFARVLLVVEATMMLWEEELSEARSGEPSAN